MKFNKWMHKPVTIKSNRIICGITSLVSFILVGSLIPIFPSNKKDELIVILLVIIAIPIVYGWFSEQVLKRKINTK